MFLPSFSVPNIIFDISISLYLSSLQTALQFTAVQICGATSASRWLSISLAILRNVTVIG